jgi:hypothetical protein
MTDWVGWHDLYDSPDSPHMHRLAVVQRHVTAALDRAAPGPIRLLSLCAGQGRDVLPILASHPRGRDVVGRLVETDPALCAAARACATAAVEVIEADAGTTTAALGAAPADLLLLCGIFGNVSEADIARTVGAVPSLLATGGTVIWTRHTRAPDLTPQIRQWFAEAGVIESAFETGQVVDEIWSVGAGTLNGPTEPLPPDQILFRFVR